jgi:hypothetical protein
VTPIYVVPRHVGACHHSPLHHERWSIWVWNRGKPEFQTRVPYVCNSWRCEVCRRHEAAVLFARLKEATAPLDARGWCLFVLTLDREGHYSGKPWLSTDEAYAELGALTRATLARIGRQWGPETRLERSGRGQQLRTVRHVGNRWAAVVEAHRSGWPHVNLMVWCPELADELRRERAERLEDPELADAVALAQAMWRAKEPVPHAVRERARQATLIGGELAELITRENRAGKGWGPQSTAEAARDIDAVCGYAVKLAGLHESSVGELSKVTQVPLNAKARFRRLRSGKGFLPPRRSNPDVTGCLVRRRRSGYNSKALWRGSGEDWEIYAVNSSSDPEQAAPIEQALQAERAVLAEEEAIRSRNRGELAPMPPMRVSVRGQLEPHRETSERRSALQARELAACG